MNRLNIIKTLFKKDILPDLFALAGMCFLYIGLEQYSAWVADAAIGGVLLILGIIGGLRK